MTLAASAATKRILDLTLKICATMADDHRPRRPPRSRVMRLALGNPEKTKSAKVPNCGWSRYAIVKKRLTAPWWNETSSFNKDVSHRRARNGSVFLMR